MSQRTPFYRFGRIEQFKNCVKAVRDHCNALSKPLPTLRFTGSVKLHGTNAAIVYHRGGLLTCQSRERIITPESDNAGFAQFATERHEALVAWLRDIAYSVNANAVAVYGEWVGPKVQNGVGVSALAERQFFVFAIHSFHGASGQKNQFLEKYVATQVAGWQIDGIHSMFSFPTWTENIDFSNPEAVQNRLVELTVAVEDECPVAKAFGISGIGEGIVWHCENPHGIEGLTFKVKGEKHSASKVRTLKGIASTDVERMATLNEFLDRVVTQNRLAQGVDKLGEMGLPVDSSSTGAYLKWVGTDVKTEEALTIEASGFALSEVMHRTNVRARNFYMQVLASA